MSIAPTHLWVCKKTEESKELLDQHGLYWEEILFVFYFILFVLVFSPFN